jgi:L-amino acid N-acyltransferase YncA/cytidylate kinase
MSLPVITIARQLGSGGDEVAALVAERLGLPLLDREIISRAAQTAGVSEQALRNAERHSGLLSRMLESLGKFGTAGAEGSALDGISSTALLVTSSDFRSLLAQVLRDVAASGPAVIIGHAGQVALRDLPNTLHVFIHAPTDYRVARLAREQGIPPDRARAQIEDSDRERTRFYQSAYHVNWYDLRLYDVVADTSLVGIHGAADLIVEMAQRAAALTEEPRAPEPERPAGAPARMADEGVRLITVGGEQLRVRPMSPADAGALLALFRSLPPEDLLFLRRDVTNEHVVDAWARDVADGRMITLLAETADGVVVGEASLRPSEVPWTRHVGEVRVITSPALRGRGLGRALLQEILEAAAAAGIEKVTAEMTVEQAGARHLFEQLGFREEGRFHAYARDQAGAPHDVVVMTYTARPA